MRATRRNRKVRPSQRRGRIDALVSLALMALAAVILSLPVLLTEILR